MTQSFTVESAQLRKAMAAAASIIVTNKAIPILNNVRMEFDGANLHLLTTDQDCWLEQVIPAEGPEPFVATVGAAMLNDIARNAPAGAQIEMKVTEAGMSAKTGRARFRLPTLPADMFPPMNTYGIATNVRMAPADLVAALTAVAHVKAEDSQPHLCGVFVRPIDGGIECAAYDGKRLSTAQAVVPHIDGEFSCITLPGPFVGRLRSVLESAANEIFFGSNDRLALFSTSGMRFLSRIIDGKFPPYWQAIPALDGEPIMFSARDMGAALNRIALVADRHSSAVVMEVAPEQVTLSMSNPSLGDVSEVVPVAYAGEPKRLGFNIKFLRDAMSQCPGDEAELHIDAENRAHIFSRTDRAPRHMMAPMRA